MNKERVPYATAIKALRQCHSLSREKLALRMEITPDFIEKLETGEERVKFGMFIKYAQAFAIGMKSMMMMFEHFEGLYLVEEVRAALKGRNLKVFESMLENTPK